MTDPQRYPVETARKKIADILDGTQFRSEHAEITRRDKPAGYLVPPEWYLAITKEVEALRREVEELRTPKKPSPAAAAPRQQRAQAVRKPVPSISPKVAALPYERIKELADRARDRYPEWVDEIQQDYPHLRGPDLDLVIVELGREKGFKVEELSTTDKPQPAVAAPRVQASVAAPAVPAAEPEASPPLPEITEKQFRKAITLAQGRATPDQRQRLTRTAKVAEQLDRNKDDEVLKAAFEMGLLTHDEVYAEPSERPVSGEETNG